MTSDRHEDVLQIEKPTELPQPVSAPQDQDVECEQCGVCCRMFRINGGSKIENLRWDPRQAEHQTEEEWRRDAAILRRVLEEAGTDEGRHGRTRQWYRCKMLWYNAATDKWECLIYDSRPRMCRIFKPGNFTIPKRSACRKKLIESFGLMEYETAEVPDEALKILEKERKESECQHSQKS